MYLTFRLVEHKNWQKDHILAIPICNKCTKKTLKLQRIWLRLYTQSNNSLLSSLISILICKIRFFKNKNAIC